MDEKEAQKLLQQELSRLRSKSYAELTQQVGDVIAYEAEASSGVRYQLEIQFIWDDQTHGNIRVMGAIDDGGIRAFMPLTLSFIMSPAGKFIDE